MYVGGLDNDDVILKFEDSSEAREVIELLTELLERKKDVGKSEEGS